MFLINPYRYAQESWTPADLASLVAWYDASDTATITHSGGAVSQWDDKSTANNDVIQPTGASQPVTGTTSQNSLNTIYSDEKHLYNDAVSSFSKEQGTIFIAVQNNSFNDASNVIYVFGKGNTNPDRMVQIVHADAAPDEFRCTVFDSTGSNTVVSPAATLGTFYIIGVRWNFGGTETVEISLNGGSWITASLSGKSSLVGTPDHLVLGSTIAKADVFSLIGELGEVVHYAEYKSNSDCTTISNYLKTKWGVV